VLFDVPAPTTITLIPVERFAVPLTVAIETLYLNILDVNDGCADASVIESSLQLHASAELQN